MKVAVKDFEIKQKYFDIIRKKLLKYLRDMLYQPIYDIAGEKIKAVNELSDEEVIIEALKKGKIYYDGEGFTAQEKFGNKVSKILEKWGAKYNKYKKAYILERFEIPDAVHVAIAQAKIEQEEKARAIDEFLNNFQANIDDFIRQMIFDDEVITILDDAGNELKKNVKKVAVIEVELSESQKEEIATNYTNNMQFYIKNWAEEKIPEMREKVRRLVLDGARPTAIEELLQKEYKIGADKAKFLAQNETSIVLSEIKKVQYQEMGSIGFIWNTILDTRERPQHRELNGKFFRWNDLPVIDEKGTKGLPGQTYNCLTGDMQITSPFLHDRIFKRQFRGETITLITSMGSFKLTPNHPVLTNKGWVKASSLNIGDNIAKISNETFLAGSSYPNNPKTTIEEFYSFYSILFSEERVTLTENDFHGDVSVDQQVNTINIKTVLRNYRKPQIDKSRIEQILTEANEIFSSVDTSCNRAFLQAFPFSRAVTDCFIGSLDKAFAFFFGSERHSVEHTFRAISWLNSLLYEITGYTTSINAKFLCELFNTHTVCIKLYQLILWELAYSMVNDRIAEFAKSFSECFALDAEHLGQLCNSFPAPVEFDTVQNKIVSVFHGDVYNLQNSNHWYLTQNYITKNCRCGLTPIFEI